MWLLCFLAGQFFFGFDKQRTWIKSKIWGELTVKTSKCDY